MEFVALWLRMLASFKLAKALAQFGKAADATHRVISMPLSSRDILSGHCPHPT